MKKTKTMTILGLLLLLSVSTAVAVNAMNILQNSGNQDEIKINTMSVSSILTSEEKEEAINLAITTPQIKDLLETADNYTAKASEIFDIHETGEEVTLVPKPGVAVVTLELNNDYGDEFAVQFVKATVGIERMEIITTEIKPEVRKPKIVKTIMLPNELVEQASEFDGVVVTVSGKVSLLGEVFGYLFELDKTVTVFYLHEDATVDVSNIKNGDTVTVTGKFVAPDIVYALTIEQGIQ